MQTSQSLVPQIFFPFFCQKEEVMCHLHRTCPQGFYTNLWLKINLVYDISDKAVGSVNVNQLSGHGSLCLQVDCATTVSVVHKLCGTTTGKMR